MSVAIRIYFATRNDGVRIPLAETVGAVTDADRDYILEWMTAVERGDIFKPRQDDA